MSSHLPRWIATVLACGTAAAAAAPVPKELKRPADETAILGTWETVESNIPSNIGVKQAFASDGTVAITYPRGGSINGTFKLNPNTTPKSFEWTQGDAQAGYHGVYDLTGDTLRMVTVSKRVPLPKEVADNQGGHYEVNKKVK